MTTLVITRRRGQAIVIGDEKIVVTVVHVVGDSVRLSIEAPHWVQVYRRELLERPKS